MEDQPRLGPFDRLLDLPGIDGPKDIFGNISSSGAEPTFAFGSSTSDNTTSLSYGNNPFAGENFWNIFADGINPSEPFAGGNNSNAWL